MKRWLKPQTLDTSVQHLLLLRWIAAGVVGALVLIRATSDWLPVVLLLAYCGLVDLWQRFAPKGRRFLWALPFDALAFGWLAYRTGGALSPAYLMFLASAGLCIGAPALGEGLGAGFFLGAAYVVASLVALGRLPETSVGLMLAWLAVGPALVGMLAAAMGRRLRQEHERVIEHGKVADELRQLEQLKSDFLSTVSHEFRTPLTAIKVSAGLLAERSEALQEEDQRLLRTILRNTDRLNQMVGGVLEMARLESGRVTLQKRRTDVGQVVREIVASVQPLMDQKEHLVTLDLPDRPVTIMADSNRLEQILSNLLANACRYVPEGGEITVEVRELGDWVRIYVSDNGPGVPYDEMPHIFDRFYRGRVGRRAGPGTGLGLSIARTLAQIHGGDVGVSSKPGEGCTFFVTLPKQEAGGEVPHSG